MGWFGNDDYILIAEDDNVAASVLLTLLEKHGYKVKRAADGAECLKMVGKSKPRLIILDVMMPEIDGTEVLRRIKTDPKTQDIPIVMCTALTAVGDVERYFKFGATGYITKPFENQRVLSKVESILQKKQ